MAFRLTVLSGILSAMVLGFGVAVAASAHSNNPSTPPSGPTQSHVAWSITGNVTPIASPSDFHGDGPLVKTNLLLEKPYYYVVQPS